MKLYRDLRKAVVSTLQVESTINLDGVVVPVFARRTDLSSQQYAAPVGMGYLLTVLIDLDQEFIKQVIKQQSKGIYPILRTVDNPTPRPFCINEFLTLADGAIALNGYVCYNRDKDIT